jgi:hypothetical protein
MRRPFGFGPAGDDLGLDLRPNAIGSDAQSFLEAILEHELSLRSRVRCVVTGSARRGVRAKHPLDAAV